MQATTSPQPPPRHVLNEMRQQLELATFQCGSLFQQLDIVKDRVRKSSSAASINIAEYDSTADVHETDEQTINENLETSPPPPPPPQPPDEATLSNDEKVNDQNVIATSNKETGKIKLKKDKNNSNNQSFGKSFESNFNEIKPQSPSSDSSEPKSCKSKQDIIDIFFKRLESMDNVDDRSTSIYSATSRAFDNLDFFSDDDDEGIGDIFSSIMPNKTASNKMRKSAQRKEEIKSKENGSDSDNDLIPLNFDTPADNNKAEIIKIEAKVDKRKAKTKKKVPPKNNNKIPSPYQISFISTVKKQNKQTKTKGRVGTKGMMKAPANVNRKIQPKKDKDQNISPKVDDLVYFMKEVMSKNELNKEKNKSMEKASELLRNAPSVKQFTQIYKPARAVRKTKSNISTSIGKTVIKKKIVIADAKSKKTVQPSKEKYQLEESKSFVVQRNAHIAKSQDPDYESLNIFEKENKSKVQLAKQKESQKEVQIIANTEKTTKVVANIIKPPQTINQNKAKTSNVGATKTDLSPKIANPNPPKKEVVNNKTGPPVQGNKNVVNSHHQIKEHSAGQNAPAKAETVNKLLQQSPKVESVESKIHQPTKAEIIQNKINQHLMKNDQNAINQQLINQLKLNKPAEINQHKPNITAKPAEVGKTNAIPKPPEVGKTISIPKPPDITKINLRPQEYKRVNFETKPQPKETVANVKKPVAEVKDNKPKEVKFVEPKLLPNKDKLRDSKIVEQKPNVVKSEVGKKIGLFEPKIPLDSTSRAAILKTIKKPEVHVAKDVKQKASMVVPNEMNVSQTKLMKRVVEGISSIKENPKTALSLVPSRYLVNNNQSNNKMSTISHSGMNLHSTHTNLRGKQEKDLHQVRFNTIPFIVGQSTNKSYHIGLNIQQTLSLFKLTPSMTGLKDVQSSDKSTVSEKSMYSIFSGNPSLHSTTFKQLDCPCANTESDDEDRPADDPWAVPQKDEWDRNGQVSAQCNCLPKKLVSLHEVMAQLFTPENNKMLSKYQSYFNNGMPFCNEEDVEKQDTFNQKTAVAYKTNNTFYYTRLLRSIQKLQNKFIKS